jgi:hypothetical protein
VGGIGFVKTRQIAGEEVDVTGFIAADQVLIKGLQGKLSGAGASGTAAGRTRFSGLG